MWELESRVVVWENRIGVLEVVVGSRAEGSESGQCRERVELGLVWVSVLV